MSRAGKAAELSTCERIFICQLKLAGDNFPSSWRGSGRGPPAGLPWKPRPISSRPCFLSLSRGRGDVETCPSSFDWQWTFSHKVRIQLPCQPRAWSSCTKNLESIKYLFFLLHHILTKITKICIMFWFLILVSKLSVKMLRDKLMYKNVDFEIRYQTLRGPYLSQILINFKNLWHFWNQNFVGFTKKTKAFIHCGLEAEKLQKTKWPKY